MKFTAGRVANALDSMLVVINQTGTSTPGTIELYTGSAPAHVLTSPTGTHLASCEFATPANPAFGPTDGTTFTADADVTAGWVAEDPSPANSGTVGYFRIRDYAGTDIAQGSVGTIGSGADLEFNSLSITAGVLVRIMTLSVRLSGID